MPPKVYHLGRRLREYEYNNVGVYTDTPSGNDVKILFHRFARLNYRCGGFTQSPVFQYGSTSINDHQFAERSHRYSYSCGEFLPVFKYGSTSMRITIYPGGYSLENVQEGERFLALSLQVPFGAVCWPSFQVSILDKHQNVKFTEEMIYGRVWHKICARSIILDPSNNILDDNGTLAIVVALKSENGLGNASPPPFIPSNPITRGVITNYFLREETADVRFEVSSADAHEDEDVDVGYDIATSTFFAHSAMLKGYMLASLVTSQDDEIATASITDVKPAVFHHLLYYLYGGDVEEEELIAHAKDIIDAANKYGIVNLKLAAEAAYIKSNEITIDNAIDMLLYADALNLALLKEVVVDFLVENKVASQKLSYDGVPGSVLNDVFAAFCRKAKGSEEENDGGLSVLSVNELRMKLAEVGLGVDGSREAMIEALESVPAHPFARTT